MGGEIKRINSIVFVGFIIGNYFLIFAVSAGSSCDIEGKFGWQCRFDCRCKNGEDCDKVTGQCVNGCEQGRYGTGCQFADWFTYGESLGRNYQGKIGKPAKNVSCLSWNDQRLLSFGYKAEHFPDNQIPGPYCRNPRDPRTNAYASSPWCYIDAGAGLPNFSICSNLMHTECPDGTYGKFCDRECHCKNVSEVCEKSIGFCESQRCAAGWFGMSCNTPCAKNSYGYKCQKKCGECYQDSCDPETGFCLKGCHPGYQGDYCNSSCTQGTYGVGCSEKCGHCVSGTCDKATGECYEGCEAGFQGVTCKEICEVV